MKRIICGMRKLVGVAPLILICVGCASPRVYFADRLGDAKDVLTIAAGIGAGAKARVGPINAGAFLNMDLCGLKGGKLGSLAHDWPGMDGTFTLFISDTFQHPDLPIREKDFYARGFLGVAIPDKKRPYYFTQIEAAIGLGPTIRLGFNIGELVDFLLGWTGIDIFDDDLEQQLLELERNPTLDPLSDPSGTPKRKALREMQEMRRQKQAIDRLRIKDDPFSLMPSDPL